MLVVGTVTAIAVARLGHRGIPGVEFPDAEGFLLLNLGSNAHRCQSPDVLSVLLEASRRSEAVEGVRPGRGWCLPRPQTVPHSGAADPKYRDRLLPVSYSDVELRQKLDEWLDQFARMMERVDPPDREETWRNALDALNVTAAAWALSTKAPQWEDEHEVRMIFLVRDGRTVAPNTRIRSDGSEHRYIALPVTRLPRMPVEEWRQPGRRRRHRSRSAPSE